MSIPKKPFFSKLNMFTPKSNIETKPEMDLDQVAGLIRNRIALEESRISSPLDNHTKLYLAKNIFTEERQKFKDATLESSNVFKQAWLKTEKWILDPAQNKTRTILSMAMTTGATLATADVLGAATTMFGAGFKISAKIIAAVGLNTVIGSTEAQELVERIKDWYDDLTPKQKKWFKIVLATGGAAAALMVLGPVTTMLSGASFIYRLEINKYFEDKIEERESEKDQVFSNELLVPTGQTFDINAVLKKLPDLAERIEEKEKQLKGLEWKKRIIGGATNIAVGVFSASAQAADADQVLTNAITSTVKNINILGNTETGEIPAREFEALAPNPTSLEGQAGTQISNEDISRSVTPLRKLGFDPEQVPNGTENNGNPPEVNKTPATSAVSATNNENFEIPKEALVDGKNNIGITYAFKSQLEANKELADRLGYTDAPDKIKFLAELGKKLGYIGEDGDVRVKAEGGAAYLLTLDHTGQPMVHEYHNGIATEVHHPGDTFEPKTEQGIEKDYEYYREKVIKAFEGGKSSPEPLVSEAPVSSESLPSDINGAPVEKAEPDIVSAAPLQENTQQETVVNTAPKVNPMYLEEQARNKELLKNNEVRFASTPQFIVPSEADQRFEPTHEEAVESNMKGYFKSLQGQNVSSYPINPTYGGHGSYTVQETEGVKISTENTLRLSAEELKIAKEVEKSSLSIVFPEGTDKTWVGIKDGAAFKAMDLTPDGVLQPMKPFVLYMDKLQELSKLEPYEPGLTSIKPAETNEQYIKRALEKIIKDGKGEEIKNFIKTLQNNASSAK